MSPLNKTITKGAILGLPSALVVTLPLVRLYPSIGSLFVGLLVTAFFLIPISTTAAIAGQQFAIRRPHRFRTTSLVTIVAGIAASLAINALLRILLPQFAGYSLLGDLFNGLVTGLVVSFALTSSQVNEKPNQALNTDAPKDGAPVS